MFRGTILSESLKNPTILNTFRKEKVTIEYRPESKTSPFWHNFWLLVEDTNISETTEAVSRQLKDEWYAHFWNETAAYVCFKDKVFVLPRTGKETTSEFREMVAYGVSHGIDKMYFEDFFDLMD